MSQHKFYELTIKTKDCNSLKEYIVLHQYRCKYRNMWGRRDMYGDADHYIIILEIFCTEEDIAIMKLKFNVTEIYEQL